MGRLSLDTLGEQIATFCRRWKVSEFSVFGSALREDFRSDSDIDVLIAFLPDAGWSLLDHVQMKQELETILGREVDLVSRRGGAQSQPNRRQAILGGAEPVYVRDDATLLDLERAARLIIEFTRGLDAEVFLDDVKTQSAVLHQLLVLGRR